MVIKMPEFETLRKVNSYRNSSHCLLAIRMLSWMSLPTTRPSCAEANAQRVGRAQPAVFSASLGACRENLDLN
jgi:hypothetical protein